MYVEMQPPRFHLDPGAEGLRAVIPARRNWLMIAFLSVWFCGWLFGEVTASGQLFDGGSHPPTLFLAVWLIGWTIGGGFAACTLLWQFAGREIITVNSSTFFYRIEALGIGWTRLFRTPDIRQLRAHALVSQNSFANPRSSFPPLFGSGFGPIAFDYGARTIRLAASLEEAEAKILVRELSSRMPHTLNET